MVKTTILCYGFRLIYLNIEREGTGLPNGFLNSMSRRFKRLFVLAILISFNSLVFAGNLFQVDVTVSETETKLTQNQRFNQSLKQAARVVLVRLTADLDVVHQNESAEFLKKPRGWLKSFNYRSVKSEGVTIGKKIVFVFDEKLLYRYFEKNNLVVWPANKRAKTLVYGSQKIDNLVVAIHQKTIKNNPKLDYRASAAKLALPIVVPSAGTVTLSPSVTASPQNVARLIRTSGANYLLNFEEEVLSSGKRSFSWKLYNKAGNETLSLRTSKGAGSRHLTRVFETLLDVYSRGYREKSSFLNVISLNIKGVETFETFKKAEEMLGGLKPTVHKIKLVQMQENSAQFELVYQGVYQDFKKKIQRIKQFEIMFDSALTGEMNVVWKD